MKRNYLAGFFLFALSFCWMGAVNAQTPAIGPQELLKDAAFAQASAQKKIEMISQMKAESKITSTNAQLSGYIQRLYWEELIKAGGPKAQIDRFAELVALAPKINTDLYDIEGMLILNYLAEDPEASKADSKTRLKLVNQLIVTKKISWPGGASAVYGLLVQHLSTSPDYLGKSTEDRVKHIRALEAEGAVGTLTSGKFLGALAISEVTKQATPEAKKAAITSLKPALGFFGETALKNAYYDMVQ